VVYLKKIISKLLHSEIFKAGAFLFFCSLISLTWFRGNHALGTGDHSFALDLHSRLKTINSSWQSDVNTGRAETEFMYHTLYSLAYFPLTWFGLGAVFVQKVFFVVGTFLPGFFMYLFLRKFFGEKVNSLMPLASAFFYMFNPHTMLMPLTFNLTKYAVYLTLPLYAHFIFSIFNARPFEKKVFVGLLFILVSPLCSSAVINIAEAAPLFVVLGALFIFEFFSHENKVRNLSVFLGILVCSFLLNFWWLSTSFYTLFASRNDILSSLGGFKAPDSHVFDALRLFGFWALVGYNRKIPYFSFGEFYYSKRGVLLTFLIPITVFLPLFYLNLKFSVTSLSKKLKWKVLFFTFLAFVGIFLVKGSQAPGGKIYTGLYEAVPLFKIFREPFAKFSLISLFAFTGCICAALHIVHLLLTPVFVSLVAKISLRSAKPIKKKLSKKARKKLRNTVSMPPESMFVFGFPLVPHTISSVLIFVTAVLLMARISYPLFTGESVDARVYGPMKGYVTQVPHYWKEMASYVNQQDISGRILVLPKPSYYRKSYIWPSGHVGSPSVLFLEPTTTWAPENPATYGDQYVAELYAAIERYLINPTDVAMNTVVNLSRLLHVDHVLQTNDFDTVSFGEQYAMWRPSKVANLYANAANYLEKEQSYGFLDNAYLQTLPFIAGGPNVYRFSGDPSPEEYVSSLVGREALVFYKLAEANILPRIYSPKTFLAADSLAEIVAHVKDEDMLETSLAVVSFAEFPQFTANNVVSGNTVYERVSETRYRVQLSVKDDSVGNQRVVAPVIFGESYDTDWRVAKKCNLFCTNFVDAPHFRVNHFANGWLVSSRDFTDSFYIVHKSETRLRLGLFVSAITFVGVSCAVFCMHRKSTFEEISDA
jgi:hypothetical protein